VKDILSPPNVIPCFDLLKIYIYETPSSWPPNAQGGAQTCYEEADTVGLYWSRPTP